MEYQSLISEIEESIGEKIDTINALRSGWAGEVLSISCLGGSKQFIVKMYNSKSRKENIIHEWNGIKMLYAAGYPVPKPIRLVDNHEKTYIIIEKIVGELFWDVYRKQNEHGKASLEDQFTKLLIQLHQIDVDGLPIERYESSYYLIEEITNIKKDIAENNFTAMNEVVLWLEKNSKQGDSKKLSLIHRDYHPWNVIIDSLGTMYVIDWEWSIGDYRFDLAWTYSLMERSDFGNFRNHIFEIYEKELKEKIEHFDYFKVLTTLRWLINVSKGLKSEDALSETRKKEFEKFIGPLIERGAQQIKEVTTIEMKL